MPKVDGSIEGFVFARTPCSIAVRFDWFVSILLLYNMVSVH